MTVQRTPKIAFGDLCRCQNPAKPHTHRSKIITNIDNGDQVGSTSSNSVQVHVQTVQILVDQIAKGTLGMYCFIYVSVIALMARFRYLC